MPTKSQYPFEPSTIENIDTGMLEHVDGIFDIHTTTNGGFKKVPVIWMAAERAFQAKNDRGIRDSIGKLKLPVITIERTSIEKDASFKGAFQAHVQSDPTSGRGKNVQVFTVGRRIVEDKTRNFASADVKKGVGEGQDYFPFTKKVSSKKIVYEELSMPIPTYVAVMYSITLRAEYQQQINDMLTPFITRTGQINHFIIEKNKHRYEAFIQQGFNQTNNLANMAEDERSFLTKVDIKVLGYLNGDGPNDPKPKITKKENVVELRISRERVMVGDKIPWKTKDNKYRE
jgi:hypothetical protein